MLIEFELNSSDFKAPSIKITATNQQEAFKLGILAEKVFQSGSLITNHEREAWIRIPIQQPKSKLTAEEVIAKF